MAPRTQTDIELAQQIGRMAAVLDRIPEDRKEFLGQIDKLDSSITSMTGMIAEMRSAFTGMIRRTETLEKDGDRCEKLDIRVKDIEDWRANRKRTMVLIATSLGGVGGALCSALWQLVTRFAFAH